MPVTECHASGTSSCMVALAAICYVAIKYSTASLDV